MPKQLPLDTQWPLFRLSLVLLLISTFALIIVYVLDFSTSLTTDISTTVDTLQQQNSELATENTNLNKTYEKSLYEYQLIQIEQESLQESKRQIEAAYERLASEESGRQLIQIDTLYDQYQGVLNRIERNKSVLIDVSTAQNQISTWGLMFLNKEYESLETSMKDTATILDTNYQQYLATLPSPSPTPIPVVVQPAIGYSYQDVQTARGSFSTYLIKLPLSEYRVETITANTEDCKNDCPTKSLASYIVENSAYAGMNGTYFCPPDYSSCDGKINSYDFAVYNSVLSKWINEVSISWNNLGMAAFYGDTPQFFNNSNEYAGQAVTAGIVNFPSLLSNGSVVVNEDVLTAYQKDVKGVRGAIGTDGSNIYLALISSATVTDAAHVLKAVGATDALNLDGGGSSAMYIAGEYKVGPGRPLPNAVLLIKK